MCAVQARQGRAAHSIICLDGEQGFVDGHLALFEGLPRPGSFSAVSKCCAKPCAGGAPSSTTHTSAPIAREFVALSPQKRRGKTIPAKLNRSREYEGKVESG